MSALPVDPYANTPHVAAAPRLRQSAIRPVARSLDIRVPEVQMGRVVMLMAAVILGATAAGLLALALSAERNGLSPDMAWAEPCTSALAE